MPARRSFSGLVTACVTVALALTAGPGRADAPPGRYVVADGTVLDTGTGLTWQQVVSQIPVSWNSATAYCATLPLAGGGWRLASIKELQTIVDETRSQPAIDPQAFPDTPWSGTAFWSSSSPESVPFYAYQVYFVDGDTGADDKVLAHHARCVR